MLWQQNSLCVGILTSRLWLALSALLWRTRGNFEINDAGGNVILFDFELEVDAVKVMMGEPWAFDRHLVVME